MVIQDNWQIFKQFVSTHTTISEPIRIRDAAFVYLVLLKDNKPLTKPSVLAMAMVDGQQDTYDHSLSRSTIKVYHEGFTNLVKQWVRLR